MKLNIIIKLLSIICIFSLSTSIQAKSKKIENEAMAFCWKNNQGKWWCDGPKQILWAPEKSLKKAIKSVGCIKYKRPIAWAGNNRVGQLFKCGKKLSSYDRDIRNKYGIKKR
ncbi:MAG: hypothetical protein BM556_17620 [Bacteriovorax sp. MedPE-SWde]|nr:MAG: hypothetical protein BM556_17620 [Bacteriovorax sp. MedPE-SWde]